MRTQLVCWLGCADVMVYENGVTSLRVLGLHRRGTGNLGEGKGPGLRARGAFRRVRRVRRVGFVVAAFKGRKRDNVGLGFFTLPLALTAFPGRQVGGQGVGDWPLCVA